MKYRSFPPNVGHCISAVVLLLASIQIWPANKVATAFIFGLVVLIGWFIFFGQKLQNRIRTAHGFFFVLEGFGIAFVATTYHNQQQWPIAQGLLSILAFALVIAGLVAIFNAKK